MTEQKVQAKNIGNKKRATKKTRAKKAGPKKITAKAKARPSKVSSKKKTSSKKAQAKGASPKKRRAKKLAPKTLSATSKPQPQWLAGELMAKSCGISPQAFHKWAVPQTAKIGTRVFYTVAAVLENRLDHQAADKQNESNKALDRAEREEKLRLTKAQAEGQEIKNAQLRQELAPVALIEWVLGKAGGQISAILDALPMQLKRRNSKLTATNIETIRREIIKTQNAAAQMTVNLDEYYDRTGQ